ncbi:AI-2E family transporter [Weissella minor]|uniref:AI-2E family transporter n=1 Tax=Weissella minor TaxID=1620 RepID=UPI001BB0064D|nr:AI-2E family transporter [Weissella minor]MBS0950067.1 AI-2E family transporter [Weissella minor]
MEKFIQFIRRNDVQRYFSLLFILFLIYLLRSEFNIILLTIIFSYLAITNAKTISKKTRIPYSFSVILLYTLIILMFGFVIRYVLPTVLTQSGVIPKQIDLFLKHYPDVQNYVNNLNISKQITNHWKILLSSSWGVLLTTSHIVTETILSVVLSFTLSLTWSTVKKFGNQFKLSYYPVFFHNIYQLAGSFISILGTTIEVQLTISFINTLLMTIGLWLLHVPNLLGLSLMIFILGIIPVAGVLISLIPLSIIVIPEHGTSGLVFLFVLTGLVHLFEAYFLSPRLLSNKTKLPVFVTFMTLVTMEQLIGGWGLIIGVPIVVFLLYLLGIQNTVSTKEFDFQQHT